MSTSDQDRQLTTADVTVVVPLLESFDECLPCLAALQGQTAIARVHVVLVTDRDPSPGQAEQIASILRRAASYEHCKDLSLTTWADCLTAFPSPYTMILEPFDVLSKDTLELMLAKAAQSGAECVVDAGQADLRPVAPAYDGSASPIKRAITHTDLWLSHRMYRSDVLGRLTPELLAGLVGPFTPRGLALPLSLACRTTARCDTALVERGPRKTQRLRNTTVESAYCDLNWAEQCLRLATDLAREEKDLANRQIIASIAPTLRVVRQTVPLDEQAEFFSRCRTAIGAVLDPTSVMAATESGPDRNVCAAIALDLPEVFFGQYAGAVSITAESIAPTGLPEAWSPAFSVDTLSAFVEYADADGSELLVAGILDIPWMTSPDRVGLGCALVSTGLKVVSGTWRARGEGLRQPNTSAFLIRVPSEVLAAGDHPLRLRLTDQAGHSRDIPLGMTAGALRSSRRTKAFGFNWQIRPRYQPHFIALLRLRRTSPAWWLASLADFVSVFSRRLPYARHRLLRSVLRAAILGRQVWLIGERRDTAQDNGWVLFEHLRRHPVPGASVFFCLDRGSPAWSEAVRLGHVVAQDSLAHKLLCVIVTHLISSHDIDSFLLPRKWGASRFRYWFSPFQQAHRIFLQHGVIFNGVGPILRRGATGLSLFVCSCRPEQAYLEADTRGYTSKQLLLCGLPRFDRLIQSRTDKQRLILLAPTWRRNITVLSAAANHRARVPLIPFAQSEYRAFFMGFLHDSRLAEALQRYDYRLAFVPHYEVRDGWEGANPVSERVQIMADGGRTIATLLSKCQLFITDHSSTQFDAALGGAQVVYANFDANEFFSEHYRPGWFDQRVDGLGEVKTTVNALVEAAVDFMAGKSTDRSTYEKNLEQMGIICDGHNCERTVRAIRAL